MEWALGVIEWGTGAGANCRCREIPRYWLRRLTVSWRYLEDLDEDRRIQPRP